MFWLDLTSSAWKWSVRDLFSTKHQSHSNQQITSSGNFHKLIVYIAANTIGRSYTCLPLQHVRRKTVKMRILTANCNIKKSENSGYSTADNWANSTSWLWLWDVVERLFCIKAWKLQDQILSDTYWTLMFWSLKRWEHIHFALLELIPCRKGSGLWSIFYLSALVNLSLDFFPYLC